MNEQQNSTPSTSGPYRYERGRDGCDDTWDILGPGGEWLASVPFWDEPDAADWVRRSEDTARRIVRQLRLHTDLATGLAACKRQFGEAVVWRQDHAG